MKSSRSPSLAEVLRAAVESHMAELRVALPAKVEAFYAEKQLVDVTPMLKESVFDVNGVEQEAFQLPKITDVPVISPVPVIFGSSIQSRRAQRSSSYSLTGRWTRGCQTGSLWIRWIYADIT